jgi:chitin disaccharide deacetylase
MIRVDQAVQLVVISDDFGMCHAVNTGTVEAFTDGIVTQSTLMVPCPWFDEAVTLAKRHRIPVGIHYTLTCDWEYLRWGPLTRAPSLTNAEGSFHATIAVARAHARGDEVVAEMTAQTDRVLATGLVPTHFDCHMQCISAAACDEIGKRYGKRWRRIGIPDGMALTSMVGLTDRDADVKKRWLMDHLAALQPGVHVLICHCGSPGPELASVTPCSSAVYRWAEEYRASDLAVLTDPHVRAQVDRLGIRLRSFADVEFPTGG